MLYTATVRHRQGCREHGAPQRATCYASIAASHMLPRPVRRCTRQCQPIMPGASSDETRGLIAVNAWRLIRDLTPDPGGPLQLVRAAMGNLDRFPKLSRLNVFQQSAQQGASGAGSVGARQAPFLKTLKQSSTFHLSSTMNLGQTARIASIKRVAPSPASGDHSGSGGEIL
jgi:hypothetical protein